MTDKISFQLPLSYDDLLRTSNYEIPSRPCWVVYNRITHEIAKVVSVSLGSVLYRLGWDSGDCDASYQGKIASSYGIKFCKQIRLRKDMQKKDK